VLPTGTLTFLFTDIEASTHRWEADAEAMGAELAVHDEVLRSAIAGHGGSVFKHTGDGVCAAFGSAPDAVAAAVEAQRQLRFRCGSASPRVRRNCGVRTTSDRR
jgi:class 3 adenylate cyclase